MRWYIDSQGNPYTGDRQGEDKSIPERPDDGKPYVYKDGWIEDFTAENATVIAALAEIDAKSIRSLRELASQIDAGMADLESATTIAGVKAALKKMLAVNEYIKSAESQAQTERAKIK